AENARLAPTTTGGIDKRVLFALEGDSEVVEELAFAARQLEKRRTQAQLLKVLADKKEKIQKVLAFTFA
ncbi:hypothetical protein, partial [Ureibacillus endophyticus]